VEMVAFEKEGRGQYGAFLVSRTGEPHWLDLGLARPIDQAVRDLVAGANDWSISLAHRETAAAASAESTAQEALRQISKQLGPLSSILEAGAGIQHLRISPDSMLTLVPFAALEDARGHYWVERFTISSLSAGRDLLAPASSNPTEGPPVIAVSPGNSSNPHPAPAVSLAKTFRAEGLEHLDGAESEARALQRLMPRSQLLAREEATEQKVKSLRSPMLLHIIGHGLVRGNEETLAGLDPGARAMNLSAIVLEEAYGRGAGSSQDGLLTALELESLDFHGSEMLVLSQCRMADGVPSSGEGVYGMRRAAAIAGVKSFVAPLWNVADSTERAFMVRFYKDLSLGRGRADALRSAMLEVMHTPAQKSFLYWAPVILSGDPGPLPKELFQP
jgi:CHAT domain-containing protein